MPPRRRSVRLPRFDYRTPGAYFVTICTRDRLPLFGEIRKRVMHLSEIGRMVEEEWHRTAMLRPYLHLDAFVVMPDHVHGIVWIVDGPGTDMSGSDDRRGVPRHAPTTPHIPMPPRARSLSAVINAFKGAITRRARQEGLAHDIWQRGFYEHVVRDPRALENIRRYIAENPARWSLQHDVHPFTLPSMMPSM